MMVQVKTRLYVKILLDLNDMSLINYFFLCIITKIKREGKLLINDNTKMSVMILLEWKPKFPITKNIGILETIHK